MTYLISFVLQACSRVPVEDVDIQHNLKKLMNLNEHLDDDSPDPEQFSLIRRDINEWNRWRERYPKKAINLQSADLCGADLIGANLNGANLFRADLRKAKLTGADLSHALLTEANLMGSFLGQANLKKAKLRYARLDNALIDVANLCEADLSYANLSEAFLRDANVTGTILRGANFSGVNVTGVKFQPSAMDGTCCGVRGIESTYGNAIFRRAVADQDYIDSLGAHWESSWRTWLFRAWRLTDYGRSISRVLLLTITVQVLFGTIYSLFPSLVGIDCKIGAPNCSFHGSFTPYYFSIVVFTTLGFGDVSPKTTIGELIVSAEVLCGYTVLGLFLSVLADKVARRS